MTVLRIDNVAIVVHDLEAAVAFFAELGLQLEGEVTVEGEAVDRIVGLDGVRSDIAMMRVPGSEGGLELTRFRSPPAAAGDPATAVNALGIGRVMFAVDDIDDTVDRLAKRGATLVGEIVQFEDSYRLCYLRGPEGILLALAEQVS